MKTKIIFSAIVVLLLYTGAVNAQVVLTAQEAVLSEQDKAYFDLHIRNQNYAVFTLDTSELLDSLRTHKYCNVQLYISEQWNWEFYLIPDKRWTGAGTVTCEGKTTENENITILVSEDFFTAFTFIPIKGGIKFFCFIDPISFHDIQNFTDKFLIVYNVADFIDVTNVECDRLSVYPNPAADRLNINYNLPIPDGEYLTISIYDMQGRVVKIYKTTESNSILDLNNITDGIYFICVSFSNNKMGKSMRIIVRK